MKKNIKNQQGFSSVEAILIVVIIAIIGFAGWYVYNANKKANNTIDTASQSNNSAQTVSLTSTKTSAAAGTRAKLVATALLSYTKANSKASLKTYVDKHINDGQFTKTFKTAVDAGSGFSTASTSPVYCSEGAVPTGFKVATSKLNGDSAVVSLTPVVTTKVTATTVPQLTLQYVHSNWSVDKYDCVSNS